MKPIVEICCGSYLDALNAYHGGAKRIELNSALFLGGLTPTIATLKLIKENTDLEVICMLRPRAGGFCYNEQDYQTMISDCKLLLDNSADGIAFGILDINSDLDVNRCKTIIDIVKSYHKTVVFHRAIDCVNNLDITIRDLIALKVDRILTSGLKPKAEDGKDLIMYMQQTYGQDIEILAGSGINYHNAHKLIQDTGINQIHSSCKAWLEDPTTSKYEVNFSYHGDKYEYVSQELVTKLIESI